MTLNNRLRMAAVIIFISALYGVLVAVDRDIASTVALGYCVIVLTVATVSTVRKRP